MNSLLLITSLAALLGIESVVGQRAGQSAQQVCKQNNGRQGTLIPHEDYCDYYYECDPSTGEALLQACPNGLAYAGFRRGLLANCDYPHRVGCPDGQRTIGQQPIGTENCQWQYGVFPHATSCTRYWHCWNGTATIQQCPFSLLYNDVLHACDWPDNVPDCQKHPICKDTPNGAIYIEKSCVRYWLCVGGYPRLQRCPAGLAFQPTSGTCQLAQTVVGCEPPPTTPNPEDDDEESPGAGNALQPQGGQGGPRPQQGGGQGQGGGESPNRGPPQGQQGPAPQPFRPSQPGVRLVG